MPGEDPESRGLVSRSSLVRRHGATYNTRRSVTSDGLLGASMKILFIEDVPGTAYAGDIKDVKSGFARNYLLPRKLAVLATADQMNKWLFQIVRLHWVLHGSASSILKKATSQ